MTKNIKRLTILCFSTLLFSCAPEAGESSLHGSSFVSSSEVASSESSHGGVEISSISNDSGESVPSDSSELPISSSSDSPSSSISSIDVAPTDWRETDLAAMKEYLGEGVTIPFPTGLTQNYVEASGTDQDSVCFIAYDGLCGDLTAEYGVILLQNEFEQEESDEENFFYYSKAVLDGNYRLYVQTDYDQDVFEVFAWVEVITPTYELFPYESINSFFSMGLNDDTLPSFSLKEGEKYQAYPSGNTYFCVGGYFDETTSSDDYILNYAIALEEKGYVVDLDAYSATNETIGLKIEFMASESYFFLQLSKIVTPIKGDYSLTFTANDFPKTHEYGEPDAPLNKDGFSFAYSYIIAVDTFIQFKKNFGACLYNRDSFGSIASIVVTMSGSTNSSYYSPLSLYISDNKITEADPSKKVEPFSNNGVFIYNIDVEGEYFLLVNEGEQYASKNDNIVINYMTN